MEFGSWAAWVALALSIATSFFAPILNNRHQRKMKELDFFIDKRLFTIEQYVAYASTSIKSGMPDQEFLKTKSKVLFYVPKEIHSKINELNDIIYRGNCNQYEANNLLTEISQYLSENSISKKQ